MALAAGLPPPLVAGLDARDFVALEAALARRWTRRDELAALTCELVHALIGVQLARAGVKRFPPLRIPRPTDTRTKGVQPATALVAALGGRTRGKG